MSCKSVEDFENHVGHSVTIARDGDKIILECQTCWRVLSEFIDDGKDNLEVNDEDELEING